MIHQSDPLLIRQGEQLVVVHHRIHVLDPQRIHVTVEEYVLQFVRTFLKRSVNLAENVAQEAIRPIASRYIQHPVKFTHSTCLESNFERLSTICYSIVKFREYLWIQGVKFGWFAEHSLSSTQGFDYDSFATACWSDYHGRVSGHHYFVQLNNFVDLINKIERTTRASH